jgi:hypothetical protein
VIEKIDAETVKNNGEQLECLHAIRFLSMGWVVLGHVYAFGIVTVGKNLTNI